MGSIENELRDFHGRWTVGGAQVEMGGGGPGHQGGIAHVHVNGEHAGHVSSRGARSYDAVSNAQTLISSAHPDQRSAANAVATHHLKTAPGRPVSRGRPSGLAAHQAHVDRTNAIETRARDANTDRLRQHLAQNEYSAGPSVADVIRQVAPGATGGDAADKFEGLTTAQQNVVLRRLGG